MHVFSNHKDINIDFDLHRRFSSLNMELFISLSQFTNSPIFESVVLFPDETTIVSGSICCAGDNRCEVPFFTGSRNSVQMRRLGIKDNRCYAAFQGPFSDLEAMENLCKIYVYRNGK